jgi:FMN phosphatase YigB (HAD superfamily)
MPEDVEDWQAGGLVLFLDAEGTLYVPRPGRKPRDFWAQRPHTVERALEVFQAEPGIRPVLARLRTLGCTLCVVSRHKRNLLLDILRALDLYDYFDRILVDEDKGLAIRTFLEVRGLSREAALMVGDTPWLDIDPPEAQGIRALLVERPYNRFRGYETLASLQDLPQRVQEVMASLRQPSGEDR